HKNLRILQVRIDRVHHLLTTEARAVYIPSVVPIEPEHRPWNINLIAKIRQAIRRPDAVRVVVAQAHESPHVVAEVVIQPRRQHILAKISALQAGPIESGEGKFDWQNPI